MYAPMNYITAEWNNMNLQELFDKMQHADLSEKERTEFTQLFTAQLEEVKQSDPEKYLHFAMQMRSALVELNKTLKQTDQELKA